MRGNGAENRWLLLIHQLPKDPAYLRVKIGRRLVGVGAIALKNSVYLLPKTDSTSEDFQWVRREIVEGGGEATVVEAQLVEGISDEEVEARFNTAKDTEYAALAEDARQLRALASKRRKRPLPEEERSNISTQLLRVEQQLREAVTTDFFGASGHAVVVGILQEIRANLATNPLPDKAGVAPPRIVGRTWVTRQGLHVDRIASAWLIRRFIDVDAQFKFVAARGYRPAAGELRFDMFEAEYSHEGDRCTFETLIDRFALRIDGLRGVAEVVHDIDIKDSKFGRAETAGVAACIAGMCRVIPDDDERLARGSALFEALLAHYAFSKESQ